MNRFAETAQYWRDHWLCIHCGEIQVSRRGSVCWRCRAFEENAMRGVWIALALSTPLWIAIIWLLQRIF